MAVSNPWDSEINQKSDVMWFDQCELVDDVVAKQSPFSAMKLIVTYGVLS